MNIEIKKSQKPVKYENALKFMEKKLHEINKNDSNDLIWILEHEEIYTAGKNYSENEIALIFSGHHILHDVSTIN